MSLSKDITYRFSRLWISEKLIIINIIIFIMERLMVFLFKLEPDVFVRWFQLPENFPAFITQPWSLITYAFFHGGFFHLFWNMIILYFSGRLFLNIFGSKRFIIVYFLGAVFGGLLFLLSYNLFPVFSGIRAVLMGASAAVIAVLVFICSYTPEREVRLILFNVKLWHIAVVLVILDLIQLPVSNPGGHLAHLGGAFLGFFYARNLLVGKDMFKWVELLVFGTKSRSGKKKRSNLKTVYKNKAAKTPQTAPGKRDKDEYQRRIDDILDKISKSGYESLSKEEKDFLFKAGKE